MTIPVGHCEISAIKMETAALASSYIQPHPLQISIPHHSTTKLTKIGHGLFFQAKDVGA
jgi:hypothetical protein